MRGKPFGCVGTGRNGTAAGAAQFVGQSQQQCTGNAVTAQGRIDHGMCDFDQTIAKGREGDIGQLLLLLVFHPDAIGVYVKLHTDSLLAHSCMRYRGRFGLLYVV